MAIFKMGFVRGFSFFGLLASVLCIVNCAPEISQDLKYESARPGLYLGGDSWDNRNQVSLVSNQNVDFFHFVRVENDDGFGTSINFQHNGKQIPSKKIILDERIKNGVGVLKLEKEEKKTFVRGASYLPLKLKTGKGIVGQDFQISTGPNAQVDLQFQTGVSMRLGPNSKLKYFLTCSGLN